MKKLALITLLWLPMISLSDFSLAQRDLLAQRSSRYRNEIIQERNDQSVAENPQYRWGYPLGSSRSTAVKQGKALYNEARALQKRARSEFDLSRAMSLYERALGLFETAYYEEGIGRTARNLAALHRHRRNYDEALKYYERALRVERLTSDPLGRMTINKSIADMYAELRQCEKAVEHYEAALTLTDPTLHEKSRGRIMSSIAKLCLYCRDEVKTGEYCRSVEKLALRQYKAAVRFHEKASSIKDLETAAHYYRQALRTFEQTPGFEKEVANGLNNLGTVYYRLGDYAKSTSYYNRALAHAQSGEDRRLQARVRNNLANLYYLWGEYSNAAKHYQAALKIAHNLGDKALTGTIRTNLGKVYTAWDQPAQALEYFEQALAIARDTRDGKGEAQTLVSIGLLYKDRGKPEQALERFQQARAVEERAGLSTASADDLIGRVYLDQGDVKKAQEFLRGSTNNLSRGRLALLKKDYRMARYQFQNLLRSAERNRVTRNLFVAHTGLGAANEGMREFELAAKHYRKAQEFAEEERSTLRPGRRKRFFHVNAGGFLRTFPYEGLARVYLCNNRPFLALKASEYTKARVFAEAVSKRTGGTGVELPSDLAEQDARLNDELASFNKHRQMALEHGNLKLVAFFEEKLARTKALLDTHIAHLRKLHPLYAATKYPAPVHLSRSALRAGEWTLTYDVTDSGLLVFLTRGKEILKARFRSIHRSELDELVRRFRAPLEINPGDPVEGKLESFDFSAGRRMGALLLDDILTDLPRGVPVTVIPDDVLGVLPFEMLVLNEGGRVVNVKGIPCVRGGEFFGDRNPVSYYQSITALTLVRTYGRTSAGSGRLLVIADPVFNIGDSRLQGREKNSELAGKNARPHRALMVAVEDGEYGLAFGRLPLTGQLANSLGKMYSGRATLLTGLEATKDRFRDQIVPSLGLYDKIVFATHGYFGKDLPGINEPVLVLTAVPPGRDGYLRMSEVMGLQMNAEIVALTACQSGMGRRISGEGTMGMGRAFQYAGARSVLMSLWSVSEKSSVLLVESFFRWLRKGKDKLEALSLARRDVRDAGYDHPFFWAPFILVGERGWRSAAQDQGQPASKTSRPAHSFRASTRPRHPAPAASRRRDPSKDKRLLQASKTGNRPEVDRLLTAGASVSVRDAVYHATPLHWASHGGHREVAAILIEHGADVNSLNKDGRTALMLAAGMGHTAVVRLLLSKGADTRLRDRDQKTAFDLAKDKRRNEVVRLLSFR